MLSFSSVFENHREEEETQNEHRPGLFKNFTNLTNSRKKIPTVDTSIPHFVERNLAFYFHES